MGGNQIEETLDECNYVVLLFPKNSIEKPGYVQVEKRDILDRLGYMLQQKEQKKQKRR
jgi:hypothetical protein